VTVKEFVVYTVLRIVLFLASFGVIVGVMALVFDGRYHLFWAVVLSFLVSGIGSYFILERQREAFARRVETRAAKAAAAFEERRAREDAD
jgi:predicted Co/Zn/Cd cation transporter (cation efflux family)